MIGLGFLKSGKGIVKTLAVLAVVGGLAYMVWDYRSLASQNATLGERVKQWQGYAGAYKKAMLKQQEKAMDAQKAARGQQRRIAQLEREQAARERDYQKDVKDDPKARKWQRQSLPSPVADWVRELAGTTPGGRTGQPGGEDREGGAEGRFGDGERPGDAGDD